MKSTKEWITAKFGRSRELYLDWFQLLGTARVHMSLHRGRNIERNAVAETYVPLKTLSLEERKERQAQQRADAQLAMKEHEETQRAFYANRDRLKAMRLAREKEPNK